MRNTVWTGLASAGAALILAMASTAAGAQVPASITGKWTGTFEFIVLGKTTGVGPASVFNRNLRGVEGEPVRLGEGEIDVRIVNQAGSHFFGRWVVNEQSSEFVCTMRDDESFLCGGGKTNVVGSIEGDDRLRMCWSASGTNATSGCADLTRPG